MPPVIQRRELVYGLGLVAAVPGLGALVGGPDLPGQTSKPSGPDPAPPPNPFQSNHNYTMRGDDERIRGLAVTIHVEEDIVAPGAMSIQLNCHTPNGWGCHWQQFCIGMDPAWGDTLGIGWSIESWPTRTFLWELVQKNLISCQTGSGPTDCSGDMINSPPTKKAFHSFPGVQNDRIPKGYKIRFELIDEEDTGLILGAKFTVTDAGGTEFPSGPHLIRTLDFDRPPKAKVTNDALAPNAGFQLNIVGLHASEHTVLTSGKGTIVYESTTPIHPDGKHQGEFTTEQSNILYSVLNAASQKKIVQKFGLDLSPRATSGYGQSEPNCSGAEVYDPQTKQCEPPTGTTKVNKKP